MMKALIPFLTIWILCSCLSARKYQPVSQDSLAKDASVRPTSFDNELYAAKNRPNYLDNKNDSQGLILNSRQCSKSTIGGADEGQVAFFSRCKFGYTLKFKVQCQILDNNPITTTIPVRFKYIKTSIFLEYLDGKNDVIIKNGKTSHEGMWVESFETKSEIKTSSIKIQIKGRELSLQNSAILVLNETECDL